MTEVVLHVYDVTNSGSYNTNNAILQINRIFKDGIGVGGIFHSAVQFRQAKTENVTASKVAYRFLAGIGSNNANNTAPGSPDSPGSTNRNGPKFQQPAWFKSLVSAGAKPSSSATIENVDNQVQ
ncbi:uncharacterized protein LOC143572268 [Bidens hawaiensis]|uniref:uncharacterized protein LOC143572268 n=1 Tax=Bidens hawaiensis TaxID=980011 RepID=UPI00404AC8DD